MPPYYQRTRPQRPARWQLPTRLRPWLAASVMAVVALWLARRDPTAWLVSPVVVIGCGAIARLGQRFGSPGWSPGSGTGTDTGLPDDRWWYGPGSGGGRAVGHSAHG